MIVFRTEFAEYFNKRLHDFLNVYFIDVCRRDESSDQIEWFFPAYLIREQKEKCLTTFEELFDWTGDEYWHHMTAFHEIGLYYFLRYIYDLREDNPEFDATYYGAEDKKEIEALWKKLDIKAIFEGALKNTEDLAVFLHDIVTMQDLCFEDHDFLALPQLSNLRSAGDHSIEEIMGIDFDHYKDILPQDIRVRHDMSAESPLFNEIKNMLNHISHRTAYRGLHESFWKNDKPRSEREIQPLLDSFFDFYFKGDAFADITREADIATGKIDFKFYKSAKEKVLIEVKLASNPNLEKGLKKQLVHYMDATQYNEAFYLVICHSKKDLAKVKRLYEKNKNYNFGKNVALYVLDASKKVVASKL